MKLSLMEIGLLRHLSSVSAQNLFRPPLIEKRLDLTEIAKIAWAAARLHTMKLIDVEDANNSGEVWINITELGTQELEKCST